MKNTTVTNEHQVSLTEWLAKIGEESEATAFRIEDNVKAERLIILMNEIGLPYRPPVVLPALDILNKVPAFQQILDERGDESVAFRLIPTDSTLPKLRNRGLTVKDCYEQWFSKLDIDFSQYTVSIFPNEQDIEWSTIFVVKPDGIFGEIVRGQHSQLTQGEMEHQPIQFLYNFVDWQWSIEDEMAKKEIESAVASILVSDKNKQTMLKKLLDAEFSHDYLVGYFESTAPKGKPELFIDYNRILPKFIATPSKLALKSDAELRGASAYKGIVRGTVCVATHEMVTEMEHVFPQDAILVCENTDVRYLPLMSKASAILTEKGGILSHAAIIARELRKPTVVGIARLMSTVKSGDVLEVDASKGSIRFLS